MPPPALLTIDGATGSRRRGCRRAADAWPRAWCSIGLNPRTTPPAGFAALDAKPADAADLRALVAGVLTVVLRRMQVRRLSASGGGIVGTP